MSLKWNRFRTWFEPAPYPLIKNGEIIYANLDKARITIDHLLSELRKVKINDVQVVALAQWKPDGTISFFLSPQQQALTAEDMQLAKQPFSFPRTIIKEGKIDLSELHQLDKDIAWLENKFSLYNMDVHDNFNEMKVYLYD